MGYVSLQQARVLAMRTAREDPGNYGTRFSGGPHGLRCGGAGGRGRLLHRHPGFSPRGGLLRRSRARAVLYRKRRCCSSPPGAGAAKRQGADTSSPHRRRYSGGGYRDDLWGDPQWRRKPASLASRRDPGCTHIDAGRHRGTRHDVDCDSLIDDPASGAISHAAGPNSDLHPKARADTEGPSALSSLRRHSIPVL